MAATYGALFLVFVLLYGFTAQRGPAWQDSGAFQLRIGHFDLKGSKGLALAHPLLIVLGAAFAHVPVGEAAWRINLLSAFCGAIAVANIGLLVRRLVPARPLAAWLAAGLFGLAHTSWWLATISESQMLLAAIFTLELNVLLSLARRPSVLLAAALGLCSGLGFSTHGLALLALPAYGITALYLCAGGRLRWRAVAMMIGGWAVGASLILTLVVQEAARVGLWAAVHSALFGEAWQKDVLGGSARAVAMGCGYIALNFPNPGLPLAAIGLWALRGTG